MLSLLLLTQVILQDFQEELGNTMKSAVESYSKSLNLQQLSHTMMLNLHKRQQQRRRQRRHEQLLPQQQLQLEQQEMYYHLPAAAGLCIVDFESGVSNEANDLDHH